MFNSARLKLTFLYTIFVLLITASFSGLIYRQASAVIKAEHTRVHDRLTQQGFFGLVGANIREQVAQQLIEDYERSKKELLRHLLYVNFAIGSTFAVASFFMAGKTLEPIHEALNQQKRFVGDAAHELKTPITALKTSIEVNLMDKKLPKNAREVLAENLEDVESLQRLTESLVRLANVSEKKLDLNPLVIQKVVSQSVKHLNPIARTKKIKLSLNVPEKEIMVKGDVGALTDMFNVFLDNAIKYSPKNSEIKIDVIKTRSSVNVTIADQGQGIEKHHQPHIFERFYRADSSRTKNVPAGYGLGLSVAKKIIEEHGGSVGLKSEVGKGSVFTVRLPNG